MRPSEFDFRGLREKLGGLTQDQIAAILKVSPATLRRWESDSQYAKYKGLRQKGDLTQDQIAAILKVSPVTLRRWESTCSGANEVKEERPLKRHYEETLLQLQAIADDDTIDKNKAREMLLEPVRFLRTAATADSNEVVPVAAGSESENVSLSNKDSSFSSDSQGVQFKVAMTSTTSTGAAAAILASLTGVGPLVPILGSAIGSAMYSILKKKEGK